MRAVAVLCAALLVTGCSAFGRLPPNRDQMSETERAQRFDCMRSKARPTIDLVAGIASGALAALFYANAADPQRSSASGSYVALGVGSSVLFATMGVNAGIGYWKVGKCRDAISQWQEDNKEPWDDYRRGTRLARRNDEDDQVVSVVSIVEADDRMVANCRFMGTFRGTSSWGGTLGAAKGQQNARAEAVANAARAGATHWVDGQASSAGTSQASVRGYWCPPAPVIQQPPAFVPPPPPPAPQEPSIKTAPSPESSPAPNASEG